MSELRVFLADDHAVVREGLKALINAQPGMAVVGEAADGLVACEEVPRLRPGDTAYPERDRVSLAHLDDLIAECHGAGLEVEVSRAGAPTELPPILDQAAYRITQEALTNVLKHAGPDATASVYLTFDPTGVEVEVVDDGIGPSGGVALGTHRGLIGMKERVELFGGHFDAGPVPQRGFRVFARLPLANRIEGEQRAPTPPEPSR